VLLLRTVLNCSRAAGGTHPRDARPVGLSCSCISLLHFVFGLLVFMLSHARVAPAGSCTGGACKGANRRRR